MAFYKSIAKVYDHIFPFNPMQSQFVIDTINQEEDIHKLLDIGCGTGSLALELKKKNIMVTGVDLDENMIDLARAKLSKDEQPSIFQVMNMLKVKDAFKCNEFDTVLCFGNTIPHLNNLREVEYFCRQVAVITKPGGIFSIQLINYDRIIDQNIESLPTIENDFIKFERNYIIQKETGKIRFDTNLIIKETSDTIENSISLLPVRSMELLKILKRSGFEYINFHGGFNQSAFHENSIPLVLTCHKKLT